MDAFLNRILNRAEIITDHQYIHPSEHSPLHRLGKAPALTDRPHLQIITEDHPRKTKFVAQQTLNYERRERCR